ncbi:MAG: hypothetical protein SGPRY_000719 [Prymnesium sp.]
MLLAALSCVGLLPGPLLPPPPRCTERAAVWMGRSRAENRVILIDGACPAYRHDVFVVSEPASSLAGNNLMMQRKVTKGRERLAEKLAGTKGSNWNAFIAVQVVLVFDGKKSEPESTSGSDPQVVITSGGDEVGDGKISADEWILEQLNDEMTADSDVQVVTADREVSNCRLPCRSIQSR